MTASAWVLPVLLLVASTLSPGFSWLIGMATPVASRTLVPAVKDMPPQVAVSARSVLSSAALADQTPPTGSQDTGRAIQRAFELPLRPANP
jgi:hypothetical protein